MGSGASLILVASLLPLHRAEEFARAAAREREHGGRGGSERHERDGQPAPGDRAPGRLEGEFKAEERVVQAAA